MFTKKIKSAIFLAILFLQISVFAQNQLISQNSCSCQMDGTNLFTEQDNEDIFQVSKDVHTNFADGENSTLFKLIKIDQITVINKFFDWKDENKNESCPKGFIPIKPIDVQKILMYQEEIKQTENIDLNQFIKMISTMNSTLTAKNNNDYEYTIFETSIFSFTICKQDLTQFQVALEGYDGLDLEKGKTYEFSILNTNVQDYFIETQDNQIIKTQKFNYTHTPNEMGCSQLKINLKIFGGQTVQNCVLIWTNYNPTDLQSNESVSEPVLEKIKVNGTNQLFYSQGSAPISPVINQNEDSVYILRSQNETSILNVQKLSNKGDVIGDPINLNEIGVPMDIVSTPFGFVILAKQENSISKKSWMSAYYKNGTQIWTKIIMNYDRQLNQTVEQIEFYKKSCKLQKGIRDMQKPQNGKLNYARGKIYSIFSHGKFDQQHSLKYSMISLDAFNGCNEQQFWNLGVSDSSIQNLYYDGLNLYVASLGDANLSGILIKVCNVDTYQCKEKVLVNETFNGVFLNKQSQARQGGFVDSLEDKNIKYFIYSRKQFISDSSEQNSGQLGIIKFNSQLELLSGRQINFGKDPSKINSIKVQRYGDSVIIGVSLMKENAALSNDAFQKDDDSVIIQFNLNTYLVQILDLLDFQVSQSYDWKKLSDNTVGFTYVNSTSGDVYYFNYQQPEEDYKIDSLISLNIIRNSQKDQFVNNFQPKIQTHYNKKCFKELNKIQQCSVKYYQILEESQGVQNNSNLLIKQIDSETAGQEIIEKNSVENINESQEQEQQIEELNEVIDDISKKEENSVQIRQQKSVWQGEEINETQSNEKNVSVVDNETKTEPQLPQIQDENISSSLEIPNQPNNSESNITFNTSQLSEILTDQEQITLSSILKKLLNYKIKLEISGQPIDQLLQHLKNSSQNQKTNERTGISQSCSLEGNKQPQHTKTTTTTTTSVVTTTTIDGILTSSSHNVTSTSQDNSLNEAGIQKQESDLKEINDNAESPSIDITENIASFEDQQITPLEPNDDANQSTTESQDSEIQSIESTNNSQETQSNNNDIEKVNLQQSDQPENETQSNSDNIESEIKDQTEDSSSVSSTQTQFESESNNEQHEKSSTTTVDSSSVSKVSKIKKRIKQSQKQQTEFIKSQLQRTKNEESSNEVEIQQNEQKPQQQKHKKTNIQFISAKLVDSKRKYEDKN